MIPILCPQTCSGAESWLAPSASTQVGWRREEKEDFDVTRSSDGLPGRTALLDGLGGSLPLLFWLFGGVLLTLPLPIRTLVLEWLDGGFYGVFLDAFHPAGQAPPHWRSRAVRSVITAINLFEVLLKGRS